MTPVTARRKQNQSGNALIEGALTFLVGFVVVVAIMEFGRMMWIYSTVCDLARIGSRYASCHSAQSAAPATSDSVRTQVLAQAVGLSPESLTVNVTWTPDHNPRSTVSVAVRYTASAMTPFVPMPTLASRSTVAIVW